MKEYPSRYTLSFGSATQYCAERLFISGTCICLKYSLWNTMFSTNRSKYRKVTDNKCIRSSFSVMLLTKRMQWAIICIRTNRISSFPQNDISVIWRQGKQNIQGTFLPSHSQWATVALIPACEVSPGDKLPLCGLRENLAGTSAPVLLMKG